MWKYKFKIAAKCAQNNLTFEQASNFLEDINEFINDDYSDIKIYYKKLKEIICEGLSPVIITKFGKEIENIPISTSGDGWDDGSMSIWTQ